MNCKIWKYENKENEINITAVKMYYDNLFEVIYFFAV